MPQCVYSSFCYREMMTSSNGKKNPRYWPFVRGIHYWPFVRGIHRSSVNSPHKGQWRGALMFSLICAWINDWVDNREAADLRRYRAHYDVIVMWWPITELFVWFWTEPKQLCKQIFSCRNILAKFSFTGSHTVRLSENDVSEYPDILRHLAGHVKISLANGQRNVF